MRTLTLFMATLVSVLGLSFAAQADPIVDVLISGGADALGTPGATVTADFYITLPGGASPEQMDGYQLSMGWDGTELSYITGSFTNPGPPGWTPSGLGEFAPMGNAYFGMFSAINSTALTGPTTVLVGTAQFVVQPGVSGPPGAPADVDVWAFDTGFIGPDYVALGASQYTNVTFNGASVTVPEPATASILGIGLLGLTVLGRRRKN